MISTKSGTTSSMTSATGEPTRMVGSTLESESCALSWLSRMLIGSSSDVNVKLSDVVKNLEQKARLAAATVDEDPPDREHPCHLR